MSETKHLALASQLYHLRSFAATEGTFQSSEVLQSSSRNDLKAESTNLSPVGGSPKENDSFIVEPDEFRFMDDSFISANGTYEFDNSTSYNTEDFPSGILRSVFTESMATEVATVPLLSAKDNERFLTFFFISDLNTS